MNRVGLGWDIHGLAEGRQLVLGGVCIENKKGCVGHSDGDALLHAIIDAMLGAAGLGDIGTLFPDTDEAYRNISSCILLKRTNDILRGRNLRIINIDCNIILQTPKLASYIDRIKESIAKVLDIETGIIGVKAKTVEHMLNELGTGDAVVCQAVVLLEEDK